MVADGHDAMAGRRSATGRFGRRIQRGSRMKGNVMKIYLAGPLGFSEAGRSYKDGTLVPEIKRLGHEILDPWTLTDPRKIDAIAAMPYGPEKRDAWRKLNVEIGTNNQTAIDKSDLVFAVLDGVDVDSGTASEIGYAFAKGKRIIGYRGDFRLSADNEGSTVNLQVEYFIRQSGGEIVAKLADLVEALARLRVQGQTSPI
jgi:nucleoside 2-deoxyribosyltransferase